MTLWTPAAYAAIALASITCAAMQSSEAAVLEQAAVRLAEQAWPQAPALEADAPGLAAATAAPAPTVR